MINLWREKSKDPNGLNEYGMPNYLAYPNSDIFDVYETGVSHQHNLSASGGSEKITYYTSFNYLNNRVSLKIVAMSALVSVRILILKLKIG